MKKCEKENNGDFRAASQDQSPGKAAKKRKKPGDRELNPYSVAVGRALKRLRESKNLGQGEAALEANFSLSYLSNVERGIHALSLNKFMSFSDGVNSCPEELCQLLCEEIARGRRENGQDSSAGRADRPSAADSKLRGSPGDPPKNIFTDYDRNREYRNSLPFDGSN